MYNYEIIESNFHGGAHIAYATTLETAARSANRHDTCTVYDKGQCFPHCCCGGPRIRRADGSALAPGEALKLEEIYYAMHCGRIPKR